jgi:hypothetical protein
MQVKKSGQFSWKKRMNRSCDGLYLLLLTRDTI